MSVFSNGTEWDNWSANWCGTCIHDRLGKGSKDTECPLILEMFMGDEPKQIIKNPGHDYTTTICTSWSDKVDLPVDKPVEKVPGQLEMEF